MYPVSSRKQQYQVGNYSYSNYNACPPFILVPEAGFSRDSLVIRQVISKQPFPLSGSQTTPSSEMRFALKISV